MCIYNIKYMYQLYFDTVLGIIKLLNNYKAVMEIKVVLPLLFKTPGNVRLTKFSKLRKSFLCPYTLFLKYQ
ncbi:hypothetical protein FHW89_003730 [Mucilaginibacter sp. SG564]|nr:hypothetical protein [Mucilaginibacter sp. SG564]